MKWLRWHIIAALCIAAPASAFWQSRDSNYNISTGSVAYQGPGDVVTGAIGFWGFRAYNAAYAGSKAASICDTATGLTCSDINIAANGYFDAATAAALIQCAVSCNVATLYEQTGHGKDKTQATNSKRPILTFNALNTYTCATYTSASSMNLTNASFGSAGTVFTFTGIAKRTGNTSANNTIISGNDGTNRATLGWSNSSGVMLFIDGTAGAVTISALTESVFHAAQGIASVATEYLYVDGSNTNAAQATLASLTGSIATGINPLASSSPLQGVICEDGVWSSDFVAGSHTTAMNANMHAAYGGF